MTPEPHLLALLATSTGVGLLMSLIGVQKSALEWRRRRRVCPSCGHQIAGRTCGCTADS
jgi:NADH pyrophosphatase NudC (nudix superfamily)